MDDSQGPVIPPRTSVRTKEKRRKSLPARTSGTAVKKRSANSVNVQPASTEIISSLIDTLSAISSPVEHHFDYLSMIAASQSTPSSPHPWQNDFNFPLVSEEGYLSKRAPSFSARAGAGLEQRVSRNKAQDGSHLRPDDVESIVTARSGHGKQSPNDFLRRSYIASSATRGEREDDRTSIGSLSIEPGARRYSTAATSAESPRFRGRRSFKDLRLKMSKDRLREIQDPLYIDGEGEKICSRRPSTQPQLRLSESPMVSETKPGPSSQPSLIRVPKRGSSARHSVATLEISSKSIASDASRGSIDSSRRVPHRDSSLRHSFSASQAQSEIRSHRSSPRDSRHTRKLSIESEPGFPELEFSQVLDDLAENDVSRRIRELKYQKRMREHDLTTGTLDLPPMKRVSDFDPAALRLQLGSEDFTADEPEEMPSTLPAQEPGQGGEDAEVSAPPPVATSQRIERSHNTRLGSFLSNNSASQTPSTLKRNVELPRLHSSPPQRSNSKLFRRLSRPTSPTTAAKHRRTFSGALSSPQSPTEERPISVDTIAGVVLDYLSSPRLSQRATDPQTGRRISFSEVGDPAGSVVFCCVGMGLTRYIMTFYDELAVTLKLRLITPDRPGVGASEPYPDGSDTPLNWPDDVRTICAHLKITKFSLLAHSAGAIYALATALRMPQHVRGRVHLLAPWIPPSQMSVIGTQQNSLPAKALPYSQRFLKSLPTTFLKAANSSFLSATSASITTSLPKSPRRSKHKNKETDGVESDVDSRGNSPSPQVPRMVIEPFKVSSFDQENLGPVNAALRPSLPNRGSSRVTERERQHNYDSRLTEAIWEYATTDANPAVDLLVCLERKQPVGFRYVDINKAIVIHHGSKDTRVPVENVKWLGKTMRKCEVRVLDGEGHGLMASAAVMGNVMMEMAREWEDWHRVTRGRGGIERRVTAGI